MENNIVYVVCTRWYVLRNCDIFIILKTTVKAALGKAFIHSLNTFLLLKFLGI